MPFRLAGGDVLLVNRGFVAQSMTGATPGAMDRTKQPKSRDGSERRRRATLHAGRDPGKGQWFTSDPVKIAATLGLVDAAPFVLQQEGQAGLDDDFFGPSRTRRIFPITTSPTR